jgi:hypothetical protein
MLDDFTNDSIEIFFPAWHSVWSPYLKEGIQAQEDSVLLSLFAQLMQHRYEALLSCEVASRLTDSLLEINVYEDKILRRKREAISGDAGAESSMRAELNRLIADLMRHRFVIKGEFRKIHHSVYDLVMRKINAAKLVKFELKPFGSSGDTDEDLIDESRLVVCSRDVDKLRQHLQILRIGRAMSGIASIRFYTKRIHAMDQDRQFERARLWELKREFEVQEGHMLLTLQQLYRRLGDCEIEIERMRQCLDNEKQSTIQLVHWKAMNVKREDKLMADLKKVEFAGKIDVGSLIKRLEAAHETLDALTAETDIIDQRIEKEVRTPAREAERVRKQIQQTMIQKSEALRTPTARPHTAGPGEADSLISEYRDENIQLRSKNDSLRQQIESLEDAIAQLPKKTVALMEDMVPPPKLVLKRPPPTAKKTNEKQITRPRTTMALVRAKPFDTAKPLGTAKPFDTARRT